MAQSEFSKRLLIIIAAADCQTANIIARRIDYPDAGDMFCLIFQADIKI